MHIKNLGFPNDGRVDLTFTKSTTPALSASLLKEISLGQPVYIPECKQFYIGSSAAIISDGTVDSVIPAVSLASASGCAFPEPSYVLDIDDGTVNYFYNSQWIKIANIEEGSLTPALSGNLLTWNENNRLVDLSLIHI